MKTNYLVDRWNVEPGKTVLQRVYAFSEECAKPDHGHTSQELVKLLDGLPFRDEVPNGRDLRGINLGNIYQLDFREFDFSYADVGWLYQCNFSHTRLDGARIDGGFT